MMKKNLLSLNRSSKIGFVVLFIFFISIILFLSFSGYTFLGVWDEVRLQSTLAMGEPRNYMMSYPLSVFVAYLYTKIPVFPWYSILILLYMFLIAFLMALYILKSSYDKFLKYFLLFLFVPLLIFILFNVSVTLISLLLVVFAVPLIRNHQAWFWILLFLASLLRVEMLLNVAPLILLAYLIVVRKNSFTKKNIIVMFIVLVGMTANYLTSSLDKEYKEWLTFQKARIYFNDKKGTNKKHILTEEEFQLVRSWWICDEGLYPLEKVMKAAGSNLDVIQDIVLTPHAILWVLRKGYHNKILILLSLLTLYMLYLEKNNLRRSFYLFFTMGLFALLLVKDVPRTTDPMIMLWGMILFLGLLNERKEICAKCLLLFMTLFTISETPWEKVRDYQENEQLVHEFKELVGRNSHMKLEPASGFTLSWKGVRTAVKQNHLLYEKDDIDFNHHFIHAQWFAMHPLFFKQHDISHKGIQRKYNSYYEYLLDKNTGIIGSKDKVTMNQFLVNNLLKIYDEKFAEPGCRHKVEMVDQSEHFMINRVVKVCNSSPLGDKN